ncbi:MAG: hypothetical protein CL886_09065 [Dehalococcoidia bacterium]|nr:hypothetical protein [Dehalococcoidia bacterium]|tara:strand:+ start:3757 stop:4047 length:291 start_codon:yes stop_codon:yes gene_type:complete
MLDIEISASPGAFEVQTTQERGHTPEELAMNAISKIISIADSADPVIKQQAEAFRERMFYVIVQALEQAVKSDRTTLYNEFKRQGHTDLAEILRKM